MPQHKRRWTDEQVEQIVGNLLRIGVAVAAVVVLAGGVLYLIRFGGTLPNYAVFRGEPSDLRSVSGIIREVLSLHTRGMIHAGASPVDRDTGSTGCFLRCRLCAGTGSHLLGGHPDRIFRARI